MLSAVCLWWKQRRWEAAGRLTPILWKSTMSLQFGYLFSFAVGRLVHVFLLLFFPSPLFSSHTSHQTRGLLSASKHSPGLVASHGEFTARAWLRGRICMEFTQWEVSKDLYARHREGGHVPFLLGSDQEKVKLDELPKTKMRLSFG